MAEEANKDADISSLSLSLDPEIIGGQNNFLENNLQQIFQKIIQERGPFRDLKEEDLQKELQKESIKDESSAKSSETENVLEFATLDSKRNVNDTEVESMDSQAYKKELIEQIMIAQTECSLALDMTSLLLSKFKENSIETISPFLKSTVPPGSLQFSRSQPPESKESDATLAKCWKEKSLTSSCKFLFEAKERLTSVVETEHEYYTELVKVKEASWPLFNSQGSNHLSVQYSCLGGISLGLGLIRMKPESKSFEVQSSLLYSQAALKISILNKDRDEIGSSTWSWPSQNCNSVLLKDIYKLQEILFEMDIWNSLLQEAQSCGNQGVNFTGDEILVPISDDHVVRITLETSSKNTESGFTEDKKSNEDTSTNFVTIKQEKELLKCLCDTLNAIAHILFLKHCRKSDRRSQQPELYMAIDANAPLILRPLIFYYNLNQESLEFQRWLKQRDISFKFMPNYPWEKAKDFLELENSLSINRLSISWRIMVSNFEPAIFIQHTPTLHGTDKSVWRCKDQYSSNQFSSLKNVCQYIEHHINSLSRRSKKTE
ncbi:hypothetical protein POMI540_0884 [Schizosaccharomyces pombe]